MGGDTWIHLSLSSWGQTSEVPPSPSFTGIGLDEWNLRSRFLKASLAGPSQAFLEAGCGVETQGGNKQK